MVSLSKTQGHAEACRHGARSRASVLAVRGRVRLGWEKSLAKIIEIEAQVDVELWARFIDKVISQTNLGALNWGMRVTGEHARYAACAMGDRRLRFWGSKKLVELVEADGCRCWTINMEPERLNRLIIAIGRQLTPSHMAEAQRFAHEYCEAPDGNPNLDCECGGKLHRTPAPGGAVMICDRCGR